MVRRLSAVKKLVKLMKSVTAEMLCLDAWLYASAFKNHLHPALRAWLSEVDG